MFLAVYEVNCKDNEQQSMEAEISSRAKQKKVDKTLTKQSAWTKCFSKYCKPVFSNSIVPAQRARVRQINSELTY